MSDLIQKLTAQGGGESVGFLNDIVAELWPNIDAAGSQMTKDIVEPMFKTMLPGPLATLHFTKIDLGPVPLRLSEVIATKTDNGIKLDMNVDWDGKCDIELDANMMPKLGVRGVKLNGRLSILLCPLTNVLPLIGAAQVAFINPPALKLDFTGAADVADSSLIDDAVRGVILGIINGMVVLPNRYLVKINPANDYFKTHLYPLGIVRITVEKAWGFAEESKTKAKRFLSKLTRASPDCYCKVGVGAEAAWKTSVKNNTTSPAWNETHDFVVTDFEQCITVGVLDQDVGSDDEVGTAVTTVKEVLLAGGKHELGLVLKGEETDGKVSISCSFHQFAAEESSFSASDHKGDGLLCGLATILIAGAYDVPGNRKELNPSVVVTWGKDHRFQTAVKTDAPGTDINNPAFDQNFRIPVTTDMVSGGEHIRIALMNKEQEIGVVDVQFADVLKAPGMILQDKFDVGGGATVRASICLQGVTAAASMPEANLPQRQK